MSSTEGRIGIDIGALYVKAIRLDGNGNITKTFYEPHKGDAGKSLERAFRVLMVTDEVPMGITGSGGEGWAQTLGVDSLDVTSCQIEAVRRHLPNSRHIIDIGGASATLIRLDEKGKFLGYSTNSLCAAGTGSFLDEQAVRLGISYDDIQAFEHIEQPPSIATRCTVFAKSDLIHRQQEGYSRVEMWSGLCRSMTKTLLGTLLNGRPLDGKAAVIGGVAQNREVLRWLKATYPEYIQVPPHPHLMAACGAAHLAARSVVSVPKSIKAKLDTDSEGGAYNWTLALKKSIYPSFETQESYTDEFQNEVRINHWPDSDVVRGSLGIDLGSTSTKLALVDEQDRVVLDIYRKTSGDPIDATKLLFKALKTLASNKGATLEVTCVGTTGSGRKLVGTIIGADAIINEISAHVAGAVATDPSIDTIFEIGGQDAKYMHVVNGHIRESNMNYVCAAGTGSFVEEQAHKLGYPVSEIGQAVLGLNPPRTSDRCTVFMGQDVAALIQSGTKPEHAMAGVMVSIVKNYLNRVVGTRYRSNDKIFFQGATARNPALVAAFERVLGVQMVVSPYCHVMGAYGVAMLTRQMMKEKGKEKSSFLGLDLDQREVSIRYETCDLCQNNCKITFAKVQGLDQEPSFGYMCGRDPDEHKVRQNPHEKALKLRQKLWRQAGRGKDVAKNAQVIGIPQALTTYSHLPLWRRFFNELGYRIKLSGTTDDAAREAGTRMTGADFCFPSKLVLGHAAKLVQDDGVDYVFLPHFVSEEPNDHTTASKFCPYVQAAPSFTKSSLEVNGIATSQVLSPVVDMRLGTREIVKHLFTSMGAVLGASKSKISAAWKSGIKAQREFERQCKIEGKKIIEQARRRGEKIIVLLGRPYNNFDTGQNLGLPGKIAEHGRTVLPLDFMDVDLSVLGGRYRNIYWSYGQKILAACEMVAKDPSMDAVYLSSFSCGPDSFLLSFAEEIMGDRPFLALELDEHGADAGYMTRIEAFFDVLRRADKKAMKSNRYPWRPEPKDLKKRILWIPSMHPLGSPFVAAAFRSQGYDCRPLPPEDKEVFELGRSGTRGSECLPTALTVGALIKAVRQSGEPSRRHAFFMPTAEGPCRFGLYSTLHRQVLDMADMQDLSIVSPSSYNSYQGLSEATRKRLWLGILAADQLFKAICKVRPYEVHPGETNEVAAGWQRKIEQVLETGGDVFVALHQAVEALAAVPRHNITKPLVGVVGEIYVRCNAFANEDVIGAIEKFGGEAWLAPMSEWILYTVALQDISSIDGNRNPLIRWVSGLKNYYMAHQERLMVKAAGEFLADRQETDVQEVIEEGEKFMPRQFEGEAILTVGRAVKFAEQGASMVVNCAPFGCMPGTLTTALFRKLAPELGIPVVGMFYDGGGNLNAQLEVFLRNAVGKYGHKDTTSVEIPSKIVDQTGDHARYETRT